MKLTIFLTKSTQKLNFFNLQYHDDITSDEILYVNNQGAVKKCLQAIGK